MKTHMLSGLPLTLFGFATLAGCSAASGDGASSSSDAFTATKAGIIAGTLFTTMQSLMKVNDAQLAVTNGNVVFTPSSPMAAFMGGPVSFSLPPISLGDKNSLTGASLEGATFFMSGPPLLALDPGGDAAIDLDVRLAGFMLMKHTTCSLDGCTNADSPVTLPVAGASAHVRFKIASGGALSVDDVVLSLTGVAIGECSATPWCAPLWSGALASAQIAWAQATRSALAAQLAAHQPAWLGALDATMNAAPVHVGGGDVVVPVGPPWHVVPPSLSIASGAIHYTAKREYATSVPAACKTYSACEGFIGVTCASSTDALRLQFQSAGQWTFWRDPSYVGPATTSFNWNGKGSFEEVVRVCASNSTGMSCTGPITIFPNSNHCPPINVPPPQGGTL